LEFSTGYSDQVSSGWCQIEGFLKLGGPKNHPKFDDYQWKTNGFWENPYVYHVEFKKHFFVSDDDHFLSQMNPADLHGEGTMG
jgi:hypothetical protein